MYAYCLILAALIFSPDAASTRQHRDVPRASGITIVERMRSELRSVLGPNDPATKEASVAAKPLAPDLTRLAPTRRRGSGCWWIWMLFGVDVCR